MVESKIIPRDTCQEKEDEDLEMTDDKLISSYIAKKGLDIDRVKSKFMYRINLFRLGLKGNERGIWLLIL